MFRRNVVLLTVALAALVGGTAWPLAQPAPGLERFEPGRPLPDAERLQRIEQVRPGLGPDQVRLLLGTPRRVARQILYHRYFEQWVYDAPFNLRVEFECRRGQEPQVQSVHPHRAGRP